MITDKELAKMCLYSYYERDALKMEFKFNTVTLVENALTDTQAYFCTKGTDAVLVFRGTEKDHDDILTDVKIWRMDSDNGSGVKIHAGFFKAYKSIAETINVLVNMHPFYNLYLTGHSLGGALAAIAMYEFTKIPGFSNRFIKLVTFGQPRTGNSRFANKLDSYRRGHRMDGFSYVRYVNRADVVPRVPLALRFTHGGHLKFINENGVIIDNPPYRLIWWIGFKNWLYRFTDHRIRKYIRRV